MNNDNERRTHHRTWSLVDEFVDEIYTSMSSSDSENDRSLPLLEFMWQGGTKAASKIEYFKKIDWQRLDEQDIDKMFLGMKITGAALLDRLEELNCAGQFIAVSDEGIPCILPMLAVRGVPKEAYYEILKALFEEYNVNRFFLSQEAWYADADIADEEEKEEVMRLASQGRLSEYKKVREGLTLYYVSHDLQKLTVYPIVREPNGKARAIDVPHQEFTVRPSESCGETFGGAILDLLPKR